VAVAGRIEDDHINHGLRIYCELAQLRRNWAASAANGGTFAYFRRRAGIANGDTVDLP
jgi:hypothetical protein